MFERTPCTSAAVGAPTDVQGVDHLSEDVYQDHGESRAVPVTRHASDPSVDIFVNQIVHDYTGIRITVDKYAIIFMQYKYTGRESEMPANFLPHSLPEKDEENQKDLKEVESGRELVDR